MTHNVSRQRIALLVASALAALCFALAFSSSASATGFCGGAVVNQNQTCFGAARIFTSESGYGRETSICLGANEVFGSCSGGPGQLTSKNWGSAANRVPWIRGNALTLTVAFGETI
jgi:hypothetical protein